MSGYCPAGKCECNAYFVSYNEHGKTEACGVSVIDLSKYEVCPWPSRRVVEPSTIMQAAISCHEYKEAFAAGYEACQREAVEAVEAYWDEAYPGGVFELKKFIAAIRALVPHD